MALSRKVLREHYERELPRYERARENLVATVESLLEDFGSARGIRPIPFVESSVKGFDSFYAKARRLEREKRIASTAECFDTIHDFARARIVCQTVEDAQRISHLLHEQDKVIFRSTELETHEPSQGKRSTGYRAIHLDLEIDAPVAARRVATPCELQIMTALQYAWGLYTHKDFYKGEGVPPLVEAMMRELSDLLNVADRFAGHLIGEVERASAARSSAGRAATRRRTSAARGARAAQAAGAAQPAGRPPAAR
jgi:ppGpp synthetase/RelA/SpoT-type nucleotidyltranferase